VWQQVLRQPGTFLKHVLPGVIKPIHALWNEVIGFFFLCFAVGFGFKTAGYVHQFQRGVPDQFSRIIMAGFCTALLAYYGITSFLKARKISRS
jgi:hypothetical protein